MVLKEEYSFGSKNITKSLRSTDQEVVLMVISSW